jgi:hypothetical protein
MPIARKERCVFRSFYGRWLLSWDNKVPFKDFPKEVVLEIIGKESERLGQLAKKMGINIAGSIGEGFKKPQRN